MIADFVMVMMIWGSSDRKDESFLFVVLGFGTVKDEGLVTTLGLAFLQLVFSLLWLLLLLLGGVLPPPLSHRHILGYHCTEAHAFFVRLAGANFFLLFLDLGVAEQLAEFALSAAARAILFGGALKVF